MVKEELLSVLQKAERERRVCSHDHRALSLSLSLSKTGCDELNMKV